MTKNRISFILILLFLSFTITAIVSCNDKETEPPTPGDEPEGEAYFPLDSLNYISLIDNLTRYDVNEAGDSTRVVICGMCLNNSDPSIRTVGVEEGDNARDLFLSMLPSVLTSEVPTNGEIDLTIDKAHVRFTPQGNELGVAYFDIPDLPELTKIEFVPIESLPLMDSSTSPFKCYQIWEQKSTGDVYMCIRDAQDVNNWGVLIGVPVDIQSKEDWFKKYTYFQGVFVIYKSNMCNFTFGELDKHLKKRMKYMKHQFDELEKNIKYEPTEGKKKLRNFLRNVGGREISNDPKLFYTDGRYTIEDRYCGNSKQGYLYMSEDGNRIDGYMIGNCNWCTCYIWWLCRYYYGVSFDYYSVNGNSSENRIRHWVNNGYGWDDRKHTPPTYLPTKEIWFSPTQSTKDWKLLVDNGGLRYL